MSVVAVNTIINSSYNSYGPLWNRTTINSVDLCNVPWSGQKMVNAFYNCRNLTAIYNMNTNVVNMSGTYRECQNLYYASPIPSTVTNLSYAYYNCANLSVIPTIPSVATDISYAFSGVKKMSLSPTVPDSVINCVGCFSECTGLLTMPVLSNSCTTLENTFRNCTNLSTVGAIPNSVTSLCNTFSGCSRINDLPTIPNNITNLSYAFYGCNAITGRVTVAGKNITNVVNCFGGTTATKNIYIFYYKDDGTYTSTYNAFTAAGYDEIGSLHGVYLQSIDNEVLTNCTVSPTPSTAKVYMTTVGTVFGDSINNYTAHEDGMDLVLDTYKNTSAKSIIIPSNNEEKKSIELYTGESINYKVSASGYTSKTGIITGTTVDQTISTVLPANGSSTVDVTNWNYTLNEEDGVVILSGYNGSGAVTVPTVNTQ